MNSSGFSNLGDLSMTAAVALFDNDVDRVTKGIRLKPTTDIHRVGAVIYQIRSISVR